MTKHDVWHLLNKWKTRMILISILASGFGFGISQSEAIISKVDNYAQRYINARVDLKMGQVTKEVSELRRDVKELTQTSEKNNRLLEKLIVVITSKNK